MRRKTAYGDGRHPNERGKVLLRQKTSYVKISYAFMKKKGLLEARIIPVEPYVGLCSIWTERYTFKN